MTPPPPPLTPMLVGAIVPLGWGLMWMVFWVIFMTQIRRERLRIYDLVEKIALAGQPVPPELTAILRRRNGPMNDVRVGLMFLAGGAALAACGYLNYLQYRGPNSQLFHGIFALWPAPALIGVGFLLMSRLRRDDAGL